jgi:hypothetical protein
MNYFKKYKKLHLLVLLAASTYLTGCTKLDSEPASALTPDNFPTTASQFVQATGPIYTTFYGGPGRPYWFVQNLSADENVLVARGGNWYDGATYAQLFLHTANADNGNVAASWSWGFGTIGQCNQVLSIFAAAPDSPAKTQTLAEVKTMRALSYFYMMDLFGNVPLTTVFADPTADLSTKTRAQIFTFIETELLAQIPNLNGTNSVATYGRPTKGLAYAILAKMYLNAQYYTGTARWQDAVTMCDNVIASGQYELSSDYLAMFKPSNGPAVKDFIFAIPYDGLNALGMTYGRFTMHPALQTKYRMPYTPAGPMYTLPTFIALYNDANDVRRKTYLTGKQYNNDGTPILVTTTNKGLSDAYNGPSPAAAVQHHLEFTPDIVFRNVATFDVGNDELANEQGARSIKFYPDSLSPVRDQGNDVPMFRYADVLLEKAEAILRGASPTQGQTALSLVNLVRARAKAAPLTTVTLATILDERGRELPMEGWRRNDLIRFGQYEKTYSIKTDTDPNHRIFPVPRAEMQLNPKLVQNPGYN